MAHMDKKIDIWDLPGDTAIIVTVNEMRNLYATGFTDAECGIAGDIKKPTINGEVYRWSAR